MKPAELAAAQEELLANLKDAAPRLTELADKISKHCYEDIVYRFWHTSMKVYNYQDLIDEIVAELESVAPEGTELDGRFREIIAAGTGKTFDISHNRRWIEEAAPIVEAFFHARFFLEMAVLYGAELEEPPTMLPTGWAALLTLYGIR